MKTNIAQLINQIPITNNIRYQVIKSLSKNIPTKISIKILNVSNYTLSRAKRSKNVPFHKMMTFKRNEKVNLKNDIETFWSESCNVKSGGRRYVKEKKNGLKTGEMIPVHVQLKPTSVLYNEYVEYQIKVGKKYGSISSFTKYKPYNVKITQTQL